ncbi:hypothetical protein [Rothia sp. ZJ1223]|nr:hypothetical protein [Rothia sp. ZJ1223]MBM7050555.1 hypothetical protein [Rothia sp. ZJ1223]
MGSVEQWATDYSEKMEQAQQVSYLTVEKTSKPAIFTPLNEAVSDYELGKKERKIDRATRRYQRRQTLGQPQRVDDIRINAQKGAL